MNYDMPAYDAAYFYLDPNITHLSKSQSSPGQMCDDVDTIDLSFDAMGRLWRLEILNASKFFSPEILNGESQPLLSYDPDSDVAELNFRPGHADEDRVVGYSCG